MLALLLACAAPVGNASSPGASLPEDDAPLGSGVDTGAVAGGHFLLRGATVVGLGPADVEIDGEWIVAVGPPAADPADTAAAGALRVVDVTGRWIVPAFVDSHVHLAYLPEADALADGGVAAAVDLASPIGFLAKLPAAPHVLPAGPMITAPGGYPTRSWGRHGYGVECADAACAVAAVRSAAEAGARVIKVPVGMAPELSPTTLATTVAAAHSLGLPVAAHALDDAAARTAAAAGVDVLAHTPVGALSASTIAAWSDRAVVSTLAAFGGSSTAVANLRALHEAGATVLYGTDFGNSRVPGVDPDELRLLQAAGLDGAAILAAGTADPARAWGLDALGAVAAGKEASLLVLDADPLVDPLASSRPVAVYFRGQAR